jgi:hypothetical protein
MVTGLHTCVEEASDMQGFLRIRRELSHFLLNLNYCYRSDGTGQQIHFLFMALEHLENVDKEIRITGSDQEIISQKRIHEKIRSLKILILNYIRYLTSESQ